MDPRGIKVWIERWPVEVSGLTAAARRRRKVLEDRTEPHLGRIMPLQAINGV